MYRLAFLVVGIVFPLLLAAPAPAFVGDAMFFYERGLLNHQNKEYDKAIADFTEAIKVDAKFVPAYAFRGYILSHHKKEYEKGLADYSEAIRLDPKFAYAYNNTAWLLATCPVEKVRNGKKAIEYATKACELTDFKNGSYIDTLAAAYAEAGQFAEAVKYQMQALENAAFEKAEGDSARKRLELYKNKKPFRTE
jgi:tetratricopeptide (TPR) repeat protein